MKKMPPTRQKAEGKAEGMREKAGDVDLRVLVFRRLVW
jgi:hypothetical protein